MERKTLFVDVILPLAIPKAYTYRVPFDWNEAVAVGMRVIVQLGKSKLYTGVVRELHEQPPQHYQAKYIESILDDFPVVTKDQLTLWDWMAAYYMCTIGEVMNAALPSGLKLSSETKVILHPQWESHPQDKYERLNDKEYFVAEALEVKQVLNMKELMDITEHKTVYPIIKSMLEKEVILIHEEVKEKYKPRIEKYVSLSADADKEENLETLFHDLEKRAPKQVEMLMHFVRLSDRYGEKKQEVRQADLTAIEGASAATITAMVKKHIFKIHEYEVGRLVKGNDQMKKSKELSEDQLRAYHEIKDFFEEKDVVLLHGVTSSGKTEVYIRLIEETIAAGKQVLYLLPEIALTAQIINRLRKHFGDYVGVYHSRFNENERVEVWNGIMSNKQLDPEHVKNQADFKVVLGARSAMFLPFSELGLIIVDEEHDTSYKQYEPAPRYNARDAAIYLGHIHGAKTLLGSATPSVETFYNTQNNKYGLVKMMERYGGVEMPEIVISNIKEATRKKLMKSHFSPLLMDHIERALQQKEQVILFQNRRGYSPFLECNTCAWTPQCIHCDVSLTYHKAIDVLRCHYCGYSIKPPQQCEACGDTYLRLKGFGTEKIEEELAIYFPQAKVARMDLDTTRSKYAYHNIITDFEQRKVDILVGTQMVTKGLDFDHVSVVGILNADHMMNFPDFRAEERSYQLMAQVSGRAGRKDKQGRVIIQTYSPEHPIVQEVLHNDYEEMYRLQLADRKQFNYPPYFRLIEIVFKHKQREQTHAAAHYFAEELRKQFGPRVLGPEAPLIPRIRNYYHQNILLKIEREASIHKVKEILDVLLVAFRNHPEHKTVRVHLDVDPL